jgi:hypothetical protein
MANEAMRPTDDSDPNYLTELYAYVRRNAKWRRKEYRRNNGHYPKHIRIGGKADRNIFAVGEIINSMVVIRGPAESERIEVGNFVD